MSERLLKTLRKSEAFQAEYEGSIPFTRSSVFTPFSRAVRSIPAEQLRSATAATQGVL
jgi:hypothetical protein